MRLSEIFAELPNRETIIETKIVEDFAEFVSAANLRALQRCGPCSPTPSHSQPDETP
jgi:hypothetical protein